LLEPIGPVHWGSYPGDLLERVMSVLLFQERPTAWRRRPSQGDGGLDVAEPNPDGYHVYQIKAGPAGGLRPPSGPATTPPVTREPASPSTPAGSCPLQRWWRV
jgi:hypothetical protein